MGPDQLGSGPSTEHPEEDRPQEAKRHVPAREEVGEPADNRRHHKQNQQVRQVVYGEGKGHRASGIEVSQFFQPLEPPEYSGEEGENKLPLWEALAIV